MTLVDPAAGTAAVDILSSAGGLSEVSAEDGRVSMSLGSLQPHEVISLLVNGGIGVDEARREARSLEEIYLGVMGQAEGDVS